MKIAAPISSFYQDLTRTARVGSPSKSLKSGRTSPSKPSPLKSSSPDKASSRVKAWDSLWSLDLSLEGGGKAGKK